MSSGKIGRARRGRALRPALVGLVAFVLVGLAIQPLTARAGSLVFGADYVSVSLGGGEPLVMYSHFNAVGDLVYSAHEGTTHIYNGGGTPVPGDVCDLRTAMGFVCSYQNHVNSWYSTDGGLTWTISTVWNPALTGFSDPSLTEDAGSSTVPPAIYNTGINLANDALAMTQDGGKTWIAGTPQCHEGDRPWLAGGKSGEVFMGTDSSISSHLVIKGTATFDPVTHTALSLTCSAGTIPDTPAAQGSGIGGALYYDHNTGDLIEPARFAATGGEQLGITVLANASAADFSLTNTSSFVQRPDTNGVTNWNDLLGPRIIISPNSDNTIYMVWATDNRDPNSNFGCGSSATPLPNDVLMAYTTNEGVTWSPTKTIAHMTNAVAWWPWAAAGAAGNLSVTWYQTNQPTDPDCDSAHSVQGKASTNWTIQVANIFGATTTATYPPPAVNAVPNFDQPVGLHPGGVFHVGSICQTGTTCALNTTPANQDRRLGDYFTNALDQNGCVMIATGDTQLRDPTTGGEFRTGRPLFLHQVSGPSLTNPAIDCATLTPNPQIPEVTYLPALIGAGILGIGATVVARRRQRGLAV